MRKLSKYFRDDLIYLFYRCLIDELKMIGPNISKGRYFNSQVKVLSLIDSAKYLRLFQLHMKLKTLNDAISSRDNIQILSQAYTVEEFIKEKFEDNTEKSLRDSA